MQEIVGTSRHGESRPPLARTSDLTMSEVEDHLLVYDQIRNHIHDLNATSSVVWRLCDGRRTLAAIQRDASQKLEQSLELQMVRETLTMLEDKHLLEYPLDASVRVKLTRRASRRQMLKIGGKAAGAAIAFPVIVSVSAPRAASAQSTDPAPVKGVTGDPCTEDNDCESPDGCYHPGLYQPSRCW